MPVGQAHCARRGPLHPFLSTCQRYVALMCLMLPCRMWGVWVSCDFSFELRKGWWWEKRNLGQQGQLRNRSLRLSGFDATNHGPSWFGLATFPHPSIIHTPRALNRLCSALPRARIAREGIQRTSSARESILCIRREQQLGQPYGCKAFSLSAHRAQIKHTPSLRRSHGAAWPDLDEHLAHPGHPGDGCLGHPG